MFKQLRVPCEPVVGDFFLCQFTESTVQTYQLWHILLYELGHHHDRMTARSQRRASHGESYAERYANHYARQIWERYVTTNGMP